ncbi:MAG: hypothetical protein GY719_29765 [bacterium]|nr:hypothetical protein [bacterium]
MPTDPISTDRRWSSKLYFLPAAIGLAVGPGNVWRFPYLAGDHGGGAFVLLYLLAVAVVAVPILIAELMVGRRAGRTVFELLDFLTLSVSVPLGALLLALFVAWRVSPATSESELGMKRPLAYLGWLWTLRIVVPLALAAILISNLW